MRSDVAREYTLMDWAEFSGWGSFRLDEKNFNERLQQFIWYAFEYRQPDSTRGGGWFLRSDREARNLRALDEKGHPRKHTFSTLAQAQAAMREPSVRTSDAFSYLHHYEIVVETSNGKIEAIFLKPYERVGIRIPGSVFPSPTVVYDHRFHDLHIIHPQTESSLPELVDCLQKSFFGDKRRCVSVFKWREAEIRKSVGLPSQGPADGLSARVFAPS